VHKALRVRGPVKKRKCAARTRHRVEQRVAGRGCFRPVAQTELILDPGQAIRGLEIVARLSFSFALAFPFPFAGRQTIGAHLHVADLGLCEGAICRADTHQHPVDGPRHIQGITRGADSVQSIQNVRMARGRPEVKRVARGPYMSVAFDCGAARAVFARAERPHAEFVVGDPRTAGAAREFHKPRRMRRTPAYVQQSTVAQLAGVSGIVGRIHRALRDKHCAAGVEIKVRDGVGDVAAARGHLQFALRGCGNRCAAAVQRNGPDFVCLGAAGAPVVFPPHAVEEPSRVILHGPHAPAERRVGVQSAIVENGVQALCVPARVAMVKRRDGARRRARPIDGDTVD